MELGFRKSSAAICEGKEERMENEDGGRKTTGKTKEGFKPQQKTERGGFRGFNTTKGKGRFGLLVLVKGSTWSHGFRNKRLKSP